jgi:hypothetical protein
MYLKTVDVVVKAVNVFVLVKAEVEVVEAEVKVVEQLSASTSRDMDGGKCAKIAVSTVVDRRFDESDKLRRSTVVDR